MQVDDLPVASYEPAEESRCALIHQLGDAGIEFEAEMLVSLVAPHVSGTCRDTAVVP